MNGITIAGKGIVKTIWNRHHGQVSGIVQKGLSE